MEESILELNQKVDALTAQVAFLAEEAHAEKRRRQEFDELRGDLTPVMGEMYRLSVQQLDEVESYVQLEDILRLLKRLVRNTRNFEGMLDQLEGLADLGREVGGISDNMFMLLMSRLDEMERKGYFAFMQGGMDIADQVVSNFTEEDVKQLGDNIVLILKTVKELTQPEIMQMLSSTATVMSEDDVPENISMWYLMGQMRDPEVKRGLARTMNILRNISDN